MFFIPSSLGYVPSVTLLPVTLLPSGTKGTSMYGVHWTAPWLFLMGYGCTRQTLWKVNRYHVTAYRPPHTAQLTPQAIEDLDGIWMDHCER